VADTPSIFRITLQVSNLKAASEFYSTLLDSKARDIRGSRTYFDCGAVILALIDPSAGGEPARPMPDQVYFAVKDLDTVHGRARDLRCLSKDDVHGKPGGLIVIRPWGERSFYCEDPFGNQLCFVDQNTIFTGK